MNHLTKIIFFSCLAGLPFTTFAADTLTGDSGYVFDPLVTGALEGNIDGFDPYDGSYKLLIGSGGVFTTYEDSAIPTPVDRTFNYSTIAIDGLQVSRKIYIPATDSTANADWARYLDCITNNTANTVSKDIKITGNLGSDSTTTITNSSSNDATVSFADSWFTTDDHLVNGNQQGGDFPLAHIMQGKGSTAVTSVNASDGNDEINWTFGNTNIDAGQTVCFLTFAIQAATRSDSATVAAMLSKMPTEALTGLSNEERLSIANAIIPTPSDSFPDAQWRQISLPLEPPASANTVADIFSDDLPATDANGVPVTYGTHWAVFQFDTAINDYAMLNDTDIMAQGVGYWFIQITGSSVVLNLPDASGIPSVTSSSQCSSATGCFEVALTTPTAGNNARWNMIGHPFGRDINWSDVRVVTDNGVCSDADGCTIDEAKTQNIVHNQTWHFNGSNYEVVENNLPLQHWKGYWAAALGSSVGTNPRLLIPAY
jgi:hypothetical protein